MVPPGHMSPKMSRRQAAAPGVGGHHGSSPYNDNVIRTAGAAVVASPHSSPPAATAAAVGQPGPMSFTRALEVTDKIQMRGGRQADLSGGGGGQPTDGSDPNRESLYDVNYEISV